MPSSTTDRQQQMSDYEDKLNRMLEDFRKAKGAKLFGTISKPKMLKWIECQIDALRTNDGEWSFTSKYGAEFRPTLTAEQHARIEEERIERIAQAQKRLEREVIESGIPPSYAHANLVTNADGLPMTRDQWNKNAFYVAERYINEWRPGRKGTIFAGPGNGTGKTYIACAIGRAMVHQGISYRFVSVNRFLHLLQKSYNVKPGDGEWTADMVMSEYCDPQVLCLDEIGGEQIKPGASGEWARSQILKLIDHRIQNDLTTFGTTNLLPETIASRYEGRIASRLRECAAWVIVKGPDRRTRVDDPFADTE